MDLLVSNQEQDDLITHQQQQCSFLHSFLFLLPVLVMEWLLVAWWWCMSLERMMRCKKENNYYSPKSRVNKKEKMEDEE
jgi:hypothetical protein